MQVTEYFTWQDIHEIKEICKSIESIAFYISEKASDNLELTEKNTKKELLDKVINHAKISHITWTGYLQMNPIDLEVALNKELDVIVGSY